MAEIVAIEHDGGEAVFGLLLVREVFIVIEVYYDNIIYNYNIE